MAKQEPNYYKWGKHNMGWGCILIQFMFYGIVIFSTIFTDPLYRDMAPALHRDAISMIRVFTLMAAVSGLASGWFFRQSVLADEKSNK